MASDLARQLVDCPEWRWMPGMLVPEDCAERGFGRVVGIDWDGWPRFAGDDDATHPAECGPPDLSDPATVGCVLAMLEEARPGRWTLHRVIPRGWRVEMNDFAEYHGPEALGEAVARALLVCWQRGRP